jgi:hypothetical protein
MHYCPPRQYIPKKQLKWSIKVWYSANSKHRCVYDFDIYCKINGGKCGGGGDGGSYGDDKNGDLHLMWRNESILAPNFVMKFMEGNHGKEHCIVANNNFTSIGFLSSKQNLCYWNYAVQPSGKIYKNSNAQVSSTKHHKVHWFGECTNVLALQV